MKKDDRQSWVMGIVALLAVILVTQLLVRLPGLLFHRVSDVAAVHDNTRFFRLTAKYLHGTETVDFDIVVGCAVHVTDYKDNSSSYEAARDPVVYVKATQDGGAIMQIVPWACDGATTANGKVPKDFLPGAVWFDNKDDLSFGIGYLTEDAFENPRSKLKFIGSTISTATREEWNAFRPIAVQNLMQPRQFTDLPPWPTEAEVQKHMWDKAKLAEWSRPSFQCRGVERFSIADPKVQTILDEYWPTSKPRYWSAGFPLQTEILTKIHIGDVKTDEGQIRDYLLGPNGIGFATRQRGGQIGSGHPWSKLPPEIYPLRADDGVPWADPEFQSAETLHRDIESIDRTNRGFAYCYSFYWGRGAIGDLHLPNYRQRAFQTRIGGVPVQILQALDVARDHVPSPIFEEDRYILEYTTLSLN